MEIQNNKRMKSNEGISIGIKNISNNSQQEALKHKNSTLPESLLGRLTSIGEEKVLRYLGKKDLIALSETNREGRILYNGQLISLFKLKYIEHSRDSQGIRALLMSSEYAEVKSDDGEPAKKIVNFVFSNKIRSDCYPFHALKLLLDPSRDKEDPQITLQELKDIGLFNEKNFNGNNLNEVVIPKEHGSFIWKNLHVILSQKKVPDIKTFLRIPQEKIELGIAAIHRSGDIAMETAMLRSNMFIEAENEDGETPLHAAALDGDKAMVEFLIKNEANIEHEDKFGVTPFFLAMERKHLDVAELFIKENVQMERKKKDGMPLFHHVLDVHREPPDVGLINAIKFLIEKGLDLENKNQDGDTALLYAFKLNCFSVAEIFLDSGVSMKCKNKDGDTPLGYLVKNVNGKDGYGSTKLHNAFVQGALNIAEILLANGAKLEITDAEGVPPLQYLIFNIDNQDENGQSKLHAAFAKNCPRVAQLLIENGADFELEDDAGNTPISYAIKNNINKELFINGLPAEMHSIVKASWDNAYMALYFDVGKFMDDHEMDMKN